MALFKYITPNLTTVCLFLFTFIVVLSFISRRIKPRYILPKGPRPLPFFGKVWSMTGNDDLLTKLLQYSKDYGSLYSLYIGNKLVVVVNGWDRLREVTVKGGIDYGDRPEYAARMATFNPLRLGIFDTVDGVGWKNQRKFAHTTLRGMGFGKVALEPLIKQEAIEAVEYLKQQQGSLIKPHVVFGVSASNVMSSLVYDRRIAQGTESADELLTDVRTLTFLDGGIIMRTFPLMWYILKFTKKWRDVCQAWGKIQAFFHREVRKRQARIDGSGGDPEIHTFIDAYLVHRKTDPENYTLEALDLTLTDLFLAGTDTISTTMSWAIIYLVKNQEIQRRVHDEIISVIGTKPLFLSDESKLPYTGAVILETHRIASLAPVIPRQTSKDTEIAGYTIPKGTEVWLNFWSLHRDAEIWSDPDVFKPDRFLHADGSLVKQPPNFLPFSAGRRICMGEQLAKKELFLFLTSALQQVKFSLPVGHEPPSTEGFVDLSRFPKPFQVQVSSWND